VGQCAGMKPERLASFVVVPIVRRCSQEQALAVARAEAKRRGWDWREPAVLEHLLSYRIFPSGYSGGPWTGPMVVVSAWSGRVIQAVIAPR
jgi:hypothetical protein